MKITFSYKNIIFHICYDWKTFPYGLFHYSNHILVEPLMRMKFATILFSFYVIIWCYYWSLNIVLLIVHEAKLQSRTVAGGTTNNILLFLPDINELFLYIKEGKMPNKYQMNLQNPQKSVEFAKKMRGDKNLLGICKFVSNYLFALRVK